MGYSSYKIMQIFTVNLLNLASALTNTVYITEKKLREVNEKCSQLGHKSIHEKKKS